MPMTRRSEALGALLIGALALSLTTAAEANDAPDGKELRSRHTREILSSLERPTSRRRWIPAHLHLEKRVGVEYRRSLTVGRRDFVWAVQGPVVAGDAYGLGFELRF
jgi:hypothetical protein